MGAASKTCSVILRLGELISAAVVAGLVGRYLYFLSSANAHAGSRIIYAEVIAGIGILASFILLPPLKYSFYCFGLDFALFICWMVAFGLLCNLTISGGCGSFWYWNSWGYYWGRYWYAIPHSSITQSVVGRAACPEWRATLAFSFIGGWCWLFSGFLNRGYTYARIIQEIGGPPAVGWIVFQPPPELRVGGTRLIGRLGLTAKPLLLGARFDGAKVYAKMTSRCLDDSWKSIAFFGAHNLGWVGANLLNLVMFLFLGFL